MSTATESIPKQQQVQAAQMEIDKKSLSEPVITSITSGISDRSQGAVFPNPSVASGFDETAMAKNASSSSTSTTTTTSGGKPASTMMDPFTSQVVTAFSFIVVPALMTIWRVLGANGGPTLFSLHPLMMMTSVVSLSGSILAQRIGGSSNLTKSVLLSLSSSCAVVLGALTVWTVKEAYAKPHFKTIHAHFGGASLGFILTYALGQLIMFNPFTGQVRPSMAQYQNQFLNLGKAIAGMGLMGMTAGLMELERNYLIMLLWITSLALFVPFLLL